MVENLDYYKARRKKDRLNNQILLEYMLKAGYDLKHEDFFTTNLPVYYGRKN